MAWTDPRTWVAAETLTAALMNAQVRDNFDAGFPVGSMQYIVRAATTVETAINGGWLECNGVTVSRTTYADLNTVLSALSYPFGSGNGSSTFHLPDLQGRVLVAMASGGHSEVNGLGDNDGYAKATRTPKHDSSVPANSHTHVYYQPTTIGVTLGATTVVAGNLTSTTTDASDPNITVGPGGTRPDDTVPYLVAGIYAIKY